MSTALRIAAASFASLTLLGCSGLSPKPTSLGSLNRPSSLDPPSLSTRMGTAFKGSTTKVANWVATGSTDGKSPPAAASSVKASGAEVHVSLARVGESSGDFERAEDQYQKALKAEPNHLGALLGYGRLKDRMGDSNSAVKFFKTAVAKHPQEPSAYNDLGLCYLRRGMHKESTEALSKAVRLQPHKRLYRNNLATVLAHTGRPNEALSQLAAVHPPAVAHYNLGYLLAGIGNQQMALANFRRAAELDPSMTSAHEWVAQLAPRPNQPAPYAVASDPRPRPSATGTLPQIVKPGPDLSGKMAQPQPKSSTPAAEPAPLEQSLSRPMQYPGRTALAKQDTSADLPPVPDQID